MKPTKLVIGLALCVSFASSCINEDYADCEPAGRVVIAVRDKNYDNAVQVGVLPVDENLPIASYLRSLIVWNRPMETRDYRISEQTLPVVERVHVLEQSYFRWGTDRITAIGNEVQRTRRATTTIELHPGASEDTDIYIGSADITAPVAAERIIWMMRTKGKLMVDMVNMPAGVWITGASVGDVYASVEADTPIPDTPRYQGSVNVAKAFGTNTANFEIVLAPSVSATSPLRITLSDGSVLDIDITITRNHITRVRPEYHSPTATWNILVMVDNKWQKIENMNIS